MLGGDVAVWSKHLHERYFIATGPGAFLAHPTGNWGCFLGSGPLATVFSQCEIKNYVFSRVASLRVEAEADGWAAASNQHLLNEVISQLVCSRMVIS